MTPQEFVHKWQGVTLKERSAAQEHFIDVCHLVDHPTPAELDPNGERFCFEKCAGKQTGGEGWADVRYKRHFGWEYKAKHADLDACGLPHDLTDEQILERLLALNLERANAQQ